MFLQLQLKPAKGTCLRHLFELLWKINFFKDIFSYFYIIKIKSAEHKSEKHFLLATSECISFQLVQVLLCFIFNEVAIKYLFSKILFHWYGAYLICLFQFKHRRIYL